VGSRAVGLRGMHERAALIGGELEVRSERGSGTTIQLEVPLAGEGTQSAAVTSVLLVEDHKVVAAVRRLRAGETLIPREEILDLVKFARSERQREREDRLAIGELTRRELEVLQLLADGLNTAEIAARLHISPRTQRNHVANILQKLSVHSQLQAVVMALRYDAVRISRASPHLEATQGSTAASPSLRAAHAEMG